MTITLEHYFISILCKPFGLGLAVGCIEDLRRSLEQEWPKAEPDAWKDKDDGW